MLLPLLRAIVAIANLCLIAATRNLWFGDSGFPMIPFVGGLTDVPLWIDNALSTLLVSSLLLLTGISIRDAVRTRRDKSVRRRSSNVLHSPSARAGHEAQVSGEGVTLDENHLQPEQALPARSAGSSQRESEVSSSRTFRRAGADVSCSNWSSLRAVRLACILIVISGAGLAVLNQHRLQPWLYHLMLLCPILALDDRILPNASSGNPPSRMTELPGGWGWSEERARPRLLSSLLCRGFLRRLSPAPATLIVLLTASIYFWSGISKCDSAFVEGHGQKFVSAIANVLGLSLKFWSPEARSLAAAALPVGELLVAISLLVPRTRRIGLITSLLMHGLLITAVGPWGMDQRPGVLLWNVLFISQNVLLLRYRIGQRVRPGSRQQLAPGVAPTCATGSASASLEPSTGRASGTPSTTLTAQTKPIRSLQFARCVVIVAAIAPVLRFGGWFDNWPSWAVYTAGNEHAYVLIAQDSVNLLPPDIRRFVQPRAMNDGWAWLRIDLWSVATVDAPLYPQKRFSVACGLAVAELPDLQNSVRILTESAATPLTGQRTTQSYAGHAELQQLAKEFTLNLQPR